MYLRIIIVVFPMLLLAVLLRAQPGAPAQTEPRIKTVPLHKCALRNESSNTLSVSGIEVMVALSGDTTCLGYSGADMVKFAPDTNIHRWLQAYVNEQYADRFAPPANRLLWVIRDLRIYESGEGNNSNSYVKLKADAYEAEVRSSDYHYVTMVDTILKLKRNTAGLYVAEALHLLFNRWVNISQSKKDSRLLSKQEILQQANRLSGIPILKADNYEQGIYIHFEEFKNNNPSIKQAVAMPDEQDGGKLKIYELLPDSSRREIAHCWGLCLRNELYVYEKGSLIPIEKADRTFVISAYLDPIKRQNQAMFWRHIVNRKNALKIAFSDSDQEQVYRSGITCTKYNAVATCIDLDTGALSF